MDLGVRNLRAVISPRGTPLAEACAAALRAEGALVVAAEEADRADLVVAIGSAPPRGGADLLSTETLNAAWDGGLVEIAALFKRALPYMKTQRRGRLVVVAPLAAKHVVPGAQLETVTGLGLLGLQKSLSGELGPSGITANSVLCEHAEASDPAELDSVASAVAFLCSDLAGYLTGVAIAVDHGASPGMF